MSVYYKFNSELNYSFVEFDGLHISVSDLKKSILHQKRLGKTADFDLLISNAQTKEEYKDEHGLIPRNTSLIVARIPISNQNKKSWELAQTTAERAPQITAPENVNHDITRMNGSEEDKIQAMMMQSAGDYDPTNYQRVRGSTQTGEVPPNYRCHKCNKPGHWIKNCPLNVPGKEHPHFKTRPESKKMTGIPRSLRDNIAENQEPTQSQFVEEKREIPEHLICAICKGIFKDAVMTPCCGSSFCDECVRTALLESEDNECPDCKEKGTSPGSLIPNRFLRNAVIVFFAESSNVMVRDNPKKAIEEPVVEENLEEPTEEEAVQAEAPEEEEGLEETLGKDDENVVQLNQSAEKDSESEDDDDNITVTVPPAHQQSRGNAFRDSRLRRVPSHSLGDYHESYSHSSASRNHQDDDEHYEEENSDSYSQRQHGSGSKHHSYEHSSSSQPQGISTLLGDEKGGSQNLYRSSSSSSVSNQNMPHSDSQNSYQHQQQPPPNYNQNQHPNHSGMMPQMHSMYPQGHYHQPSGPYYPPNPIRPMRFDHQGNYQMPMRHHHPSQMMRPSMHENFNMRQQRPPMNHNLASAVTHNIQQRYGTGIIDDPLEAFNRIMREKELRKERYQRSPAHNNERRSRSFDRKRSPAHPYSPDNRRQKNYSKVRKRSRSFKSNSSKSYSRSRSRSRNRSTRGRSKSRSYSPRYRRKENVQSKDRRDERHRSPPRRGGNQHNNARGSRSSYKNEQSYKQGLRDPQEIHQYHDNVGNQHEKIDQNFDYQKDANMFETPHSLDEQPPPPGDESELLNLHVMPATLDNEAQEKINTSKADDVPKDSAETNGSHRTDVDSKRTDQELKKSDHHHHHKKSSRSKNYETSSDDKKVREKKKQKKSREHEKKKSKKDRKVRSEKDKDKKSSSKAGSKEKTPEAATVVQAEHVEADSTEDKLQAQEHIEDMMEDYQEPVSLEVEAAAVQVKSTLDNKLKRSDSFLDINPNVDLDLDEWIAPEVSKWEREENKSLDNSEADVGNGEVKKSTEEKVTSEILKRAENAIFARAISAIRPMESKKVKAVQEHDSGSTRQEISPLTSAVKKLDSGRDSKIHAYQVTVPVSESGTRSVELKSSEGSRKKSPMKSSIKNRLGIKVIEKKSRSRTPSRSPKRRLQSDCTKVVKSSRDSGSRSGQTERDRPGQTERDRSGQTERDRPGQSERDRSGRERYPSTENRRNKPMSSFIKVSQDTRDVSHNSRSRYNDKRRSTPPDDRKPVKRYRASRSRSKSRHNTRRHDQKSNAEKSSHRSRELPTRSDDKSSKVAEHPLSDVEKAKAKGSREAEPLIKKRSRDSSSSSTSSSASSNDSQKPSKKHGKHKVKKKSRSPSAESNSNSKRKKSKKDKKAKKKKKSRK